MRLFFFAIAIIFWASFSFYNGSGENSVTSLFVDIDTASYQHVADWLFQKTSVQDIYYHLSIRPIGYPLFIGFSKQFGNLSLLIVQVALWYLSQRLIFCVLVERSQSMIFASLGTALSITCLAHVAMTHHILSEALSLPLLAISLFFLHRYFYTEKFNYAAALIFILALNSIVRPAESFFLWPVLFFFIVKYRNSLIKIGIMILCTAPFITQLIIMVFFFNIANLSIIGHRTIDQFLLTKVDFGETGIPMPIMRALRDYNGINKIVVDGKPDEIKEYKNYAQDQLFEYLTKKPIMTLITYTLNIHKNMQAKSLIVSKNSMILYKIAHLQSFVLCYTGMIISILFSGYLLSMFSKNKIHTFNEVGFELFLIFSISIHLLQSGVSYFQGDRLTLAVFQPTILLTLFVSRKALNMARCKNRDISVPVHS